MILIRILDTIDRVVLKRANLIKKLLIYRWGAANMSKYNYTAREILQKEFKQKMRGYDPIEVDEFLDGIIKDYELFNREVLDLREENQRLVAKVDQLTKSTETLSRIRQDAPKQVNTSTNFDIIKRLSSLENKVFNLENKVFSEETEKTVTPNTDDLEQTKQF